MTVRREARNWKALAACVTFVRASRLGEEGSNPYIPTAAFVLDRSAAATLSCL
jgi:hypothetical protein